MEKIVLLKDKLLEVSVNDRRIAAINGEKISLSVDDILTLLDPNKEVVPCAFVKTNDNGVLTWLVEAFENNYYEKSAKNLMIQNRSVVIPTNGLQLSRELLSALAGLYHNISLVLYNKFSSYENPLGRRGKHQVIVPQVQGNLRDIKGSWQVPGPETLYFDYKGNIHSPYGAVDEAALLRCLCIYRQGTTLALLRQLEGCEVVSPDGDTTYDVILKGGEKYFSVNGVKRNDSTGTFVEARISSTMDVFRTLVTLIGSGYSTSIDLRLMAEPDPGKELITDPKNWCFGS